ncbi:MAG: hypothetical protein JO159_06450 [Acidobacteria bacterium]|nr:hypothetical protein [Acidobacteriota bacterium]MBV9622841.1 hypothetical protein [Acidobacteriota bacterium]
MPRIFTFIVLLFFSSSAFAASQPAATVRWTEGAADSTVRAAGDGHTYYTLSHGDLDVTLGLDNQELEKISRRVIPMVGVMLSLNYKGRGEFDIRQNRFTLEFVKHFQVVQSSVDPDQMLRHLEDDIEELNREFRKQAKRNDQKQSNDLQARIKDCMDMMVFVSTRAMRPDTLNGSSSSSGWVFFSTKSRWIGAWRRPEQFVLRLPLENVVFEFPFELPPKEGKPGLRLRPN